MLDRLRTAAMDEGFVLCGVAPAVQSTGYADLIQWIESGYAGEMNYFADRQHAYQHPSGVLAGARSVIALAYPYDQTPLQPDACQHPQDDRATHQPTGRGIGKVARYAWSGSDYHDTIHPKLKRLCRIVQECNPDANVRGVVDTAPLMEREFAQLAGLGWRGKNTLLLNKQLGSYFFLACLLTDIELPYDDAHTSSHCGTCTACLDACPTDAFPGPGVLDATRCISYLTIEYRGHVERGLRSGIGDWLFGCDICQEVCPWNRKPARRAAQTDQPLQTLALADLFRLSETEFRERFRKTPMWRTRRRGMLRNAAIVLGNQRASDAIPELIVGLHDGEAIVRGASAWALGEMLDQRSIDALKHRKTMETDSDVRSEIESVLQR